MAADLGDGGRPGQLRRPRHRRHALGGRPARRRADPTAEQAALAARQPMGRLVTADEVAAAVVYLASPATGSVTGSSLPVDGGMSGLRLPAPVPPTAGTGEPGA